MEVGFREHEVRGRKFLVWVPEGYRPGTAHPTILFLHGMGESGTDPAIHRQHSLGQAIQANPERWPFLVILPQKADAWVLWPGYQSFLNAVLSLVEKEYTVDSKHCYLTGLSQGGNGTFALAARLKWRFAAIAPVCGWCDPMQAATELEDVPVWCFHGAKDGAVPVDCSRAAMRILQRGEEVSDRKYTEYPELEHNCWDAAYGDPELPQWFLRHGI